MEKMESRQIENIGGKREKKVRQENFGTLTKWKEIAANLSNDPPKENNSLIGGCQRETELLQLADLFVDGNMENLLKGRVGVSVW